MPTPKGNMRELLLKTIAQCNDVETLHPAMRSLCERFGTITRLDILPSAHIGTGKTLCLLRMDTPEQDRRIAQALGIGRFGGDLVLLIDLPQREAENTCHFNDHTGDPAQPLRRFDVM